MSVLVFEGDPVPRSMLRDSEQGVFDLFLGRGPKGDPGVSLIVGNMVGQLLPKTGVSKFFNYSGVTQHLSVVGVSVGLPPQGGPLVVDVLMDDVTLFPNPVDRPTILAGEVTSGPVALGVDFPPMSYLTVDLVEVGLTFPGDSLVAQIERL